MQQLLTQGRITDTAVPLALAEPGDARRGRRGLWV